MKALFIGGTGTISADIVALAASRGWEMTLLNRGLRTLELPQGVATITADIGDEAAVAAAIAGKHYDVIADFICFTPEQAQRDVRLFAGKCDQFFFISSASAYHKPVQHYLIDESTPLHNPHWQYSRDKAACEALFMEAYRQSGFPVTLIRPSHTYCARSLPVPVHGKNGAYQVLKRMLEGKPVIVPGDGTSLWTITHSTDFAKAFVGLMGHTKAVGEAFTITSDEQMTWDQIVKGIGRALGKEALPYHVASDFLVACDPSLEGPLLGDKSNTVVFDNSKVKRLVPDFVCTTRFDLGVRMYVAYLDAHPEMKVADPAFDAWCDRVIAAHEAGKRAFAQMQEQPV